MQFKPRQYIIISAFSGPVPQSSAHPIELMTPDVLDARTSEPQLDFSDEEENFEEEPVPLTELEICKMEVKALASQLVRNIVPHLELDKDGSTSSLLENINHLKSVVEVSLWLYLKYIDTVAKIFF